MRHTLISLASLACLLTAAVVPAVGQTSRAEEEEEKLGVTLSTNVDIYDSAKADIEMAEDLEIMGSVLRAAVTELYAPARGAQARQAARNHVLNLAYNTPSPLQGITMATTDRELMATGHGAKGPSFAAEYHLNPSAIKRPEGAYLDGYGVLLQLTLDVAPPEQQRSADAPEKADTGSKRPGPWETAVRRLRGQTAQPSAKDAASDQIVHRVPAKDDLVKELLDVMVENAPNFRHLTDKDRLAVAITFPRTKVPVKSTEMSHTTFGTMLLRDELVRLERADVRGSHEVSGDLHMRQKDYPKAVEAYTRAVKAGSRSPEEKRALQIKLTQAYVAAGDLRNAQVWIEFLTTEIAAEPKHKNGTSRAEGAREIPLPARLTVSVLKSRLDEVAAGKLKREELGKHATVRYFSPPPEVPGLGSPRKAAVSTDDRYFYYDYGSNQRVPAR